MSSVEMSLPELITDENALEIRAMLQEFLLGKLWDIVKVRSFRSQELPVTEVVQGILVLGVDCARTVNDQLNVDIRITDPLKNCGVSCPTADGQTGACSSLFVRDGILVLSWTDQFECGSITFLPA